MDQTNSNTLSAASSNAKQQQAKVELENELVETDSLNETRATGGAPVVKDSAIEEENMETHKTHGNACGSEGHETAKSAIQIIENVVLCSAKNSAVLQSEAPIDSRLESQTVAVIGASEAQNLSESVEFAAQMNMNVVSENNTTANAKTAAQPAEQITAMDTNAHSEDFAHISETLPERNTVAESRQQSMEAECAMDTSEASVSAASKEAEITEKSASSDTTILPQSMSLAQGSDSASGLALLAQYGSDTDNDADGEKSDEEISPEPKSAIVTSNESTAAAHNPATVSVNEDEMPRIRAERAPMDINNLTYREAIIEIDSDDSSSSSDSDSEYLTKIRQEIDKAIKVESEEEHDEEEDDDNSSVKGKKRNQPRVKGELLLEDLPPIQDLRITVPEEECIELGKVHSIVDQLLLVSVLPNSVLLDLETVLFLEKGKRVLGEVFDVLGQVTDPLYCVRFNSNKQIKEKKIEVGDLVYVAPKTKYTQYIILSSLMKMRGSDASWEHDVEPPPRYLDYSDDEEEREARHRNRKRNANSTEHNAAGMQVSTDAVPTTRVAHQPDQNSRYAPRSRGQTNRVTDNWQERQVKQEPQYNQLSGSWHSNYMPSYQASRSPMPAYGNQRPPHVRSMPPPHFINRPPTHFGNFPPMQMPQSMPVVPQMMQMPVPPPPQPFVNMSSYSIPPPSRQQFVMNPYAVRPPVLGSQFQAPEANNYEEPPPPPPGV